MTLVERLGEGLARRLDRRRFLRRSAATTFGVVAAWAIEGIGVPGALASHCATTSSDCQCHPPGGRFCAYSQCSGANCAGGCTLDTSWYDTGCWCTLTCHGGHYRCCDCNCGGTSCGCVEFVPSFVPATTPPPLPDGVDDEVTICHEGETMQVRRVALRAYLALGDTEGPCA